MDILLISNNKLLPSFSRYIQFKESQGYYVASISTETIYENYTGRDNPEKIRTCIQYYYYNHHIQYVILGGTSLPAEPENSVIPHRGLYVECPPLTDYDIPGDIYYACLNGTWGGENNVWGRPGDEDLFAEVSVGRWPVKNETEINTITEKLIKYQDNPVVSDILKMHSLGEKLTSTPYDIYGDVCMEETINYAPVPSYFTNYRLYDSVTPWTQFDTINAFNNIGIGIMNHLGHGSNIGVFKVTAGYLENPSGKKYFFNDGITKGFPVAYTQACYAGAFDGRTGTVGQYARNFCISGLFTTIPEGIAAIITNSRYGFYSVGSGTNSPSQFFSKEFFKALFTKNITQIGKALNESKEVNAPSINLNSMMRWCYYEINLFGDPSMDIWTNIPTNIVAQYPESINIGETQITITTDTPNARVACLSNNILIGRGVTDISGVTTIIFDNSISGNTLNISIIAHNKNRYYGTINVNTNGRIVGQVTYDNVYNNPLSGVNIRIYKDNDSEVYFNTTSDENGNYLFDNIPYGNYSISLSCDKKVGGINSSDALLIMEHFTEITQLEGLKLKAADVNGDGAVNSTDALLVQKLFVGMISEFPVGKWCFEDKIVTVNSLETITNIKGICYGDVNGDFIPK